MQQLQIKLQVHQQLYLTGSFESKTNIPMVPQIFLFLTTLLIQEDSGLLLEGLFILQRWGAKGNKQSIKTFHAITRHSQNKINKKYKGILKTTPYKAGSKHICAMCCNSIYCCCFYLSGSLEPQTYCSGIAFNLILFVGTTFLVKENGRLTLKRTFSLILQEQTKIDDTST